MIETVDNWGRENVHATLLAVGVKQRDLPDYGDPLAVRHPQRPVAVAPMKKPAAGIDEMKQFFAGAIDYSPKEPPSG